MKRTRFFSLTLAAALVVAFALPVPSWGQDDEDGPGRGVARLSLMNGDVSVRRGDSGDWIAGALNAPLLVEDRVTTGPGSRAEVQFDYHHRIRIAEDSEIRLSEVEWRRYQIQVARGTVTFAALKGGDAQVEISTPGASVRPVAHGSYRVAVQPDGTAEITVRSGEVEIFTPRGTQRLRSGQAIMVRPATDGASEFSMTSAAPRDAWDQFNEQRDKELRRGDAYYSQYVSRDVYGAEDLYGHGTWVNVAPYGHVWRPAVAVGWAPYRDGRWVWLDWYGWSWVSYDPWGWAPYHYGRWFFNAGAWYWHPGAYRARHYWSPALVGWFGWSSWGGVSVGIGFGGPAYGWVPLAPYERCYRWWGPRYYNGYRNGNFVQNNVNIVNNVNVTNIYRNARVGNAVTVINGNDFSRGRAFRASADDLKRAGVVRGAVPVAPGRDNLRFNDRVVRSGDAMRAGGSANERFYSRNTPTRVDRVPFDQQRATIEQASRRSLAGGPRDGDSVRGGAAGGSDGFRSRTTEPANGWRNFGDPRNGSTRAGDGADASRGSSARTGDTSTRGMERSLTGRSGQAVSGGAAENDASRGSNGWRRFGDPGSSSRGNTAERSVGDARGGEATGRSGSSTERSTGGGWRRFGDAPSDRTASPAVGGDGPRATAPESSGRSWSTGSGRSGGETRSVTPGASGGRSGSETRSVTPDAGRSSTGSGRSWSTGGGRSGGETRSVSPSTGGGAGGRSGGSEGRMSAPRSEPSGGGRQFSAPSTGGGSGGSRSGGSMSAPRSFGGSSGGGMRSAPSGGGGGGMRSAPSGGGGSGFSGGSRSGGGGAAGGGGGARGGASSSGARGGGRR